jgi:hypothetical protein
LRDADSKRVENLRHDCFDFCATLRTRRALAKIQAKSSISIWDHPYGVRSFYLEGHIMSNHNQHSPTKQTGDARQANWETALRIATVMAESNERLFKIQSEAANAAFAENSKHRRALLDTANTKDSGALLAEWTGLYQANMRRVLDVTRSSFEIVPHTQAEIAKLVGEPFASANKETQKYLDQFTKAISDGRDSATASVKDFLAKAIASANASKSSKKEKVA